MSDPLSPIAMLRAWETGAGLAPLDRAVAMLWAAGMDGDPAGLPLAERDRRLLALRCATFGRPLEVVTACPECEAAVELALDAADLEAALTANEAGPVEIDGEALGLRALTSHDLAAAAGVTETDLPGFLRTRLLEDAGALPDAAIAQVDGAIAAQAEAAELTLAMACPDCGQGWSDQVDVPDLLWREVEAAAGHLLEDVADLAAAFGWREADILALPVARRAAYLRLVRAS